VVGGPTVHVASFADLSPRTLHDIVRMRIDTFVVEQGCAYPELDGRDVLESTRHAWIELDGAPVCYLRVYPAEDEGSWIGRVVTARAHRSRGLAGLLMRHVLATVARPVHISAQSRVAGWYARLGFVSSGPEYVEDGIPHTPMRLDSGPGPAPLDTL
jgi:ElaA protein